MQAAGKVVAEAIREMARRVRPGVTTAELDDVAAQIFNRHGARSGPQLDYDFPGVTCISLDDECVHGIPSRTRRVNAGQRRDTIRHIDHVSGRQGGMGGHVL